jgi:Xaa-Pro aminopeptidase
MAERSLDALLIYATPIDDAAVRWLSNFKPFAGHAMIALRREGEPVLFGDRVMHGEPMHTLYWLTWFRNAEAVGADSTIPREVVRLLGNEGAVGRIGVSGLAELPGSWTATLSEGLPGAVFEDADQLMLQLRVIKTPAEVEKMRQAALITGQAMRIAMDACRPGVSEFQVAGLAHHAIFSLGAEDLAFDTAVVAGPRAGLKHGVATGRLMQEGDMVFLDMGAKFDGYHADVSRTIVVGEPDDYQRRLLRTAEAMFAVWTADAGPGVAIRDIQAKCEKVALDAGFEEEYMPLGWGHGLGTSLFELPMLTYRGDTVLREGMTFALEPMLVKLGIGTAVVEETVLITSQGMVSLSGLPTTIYT